MKNIVSILFILFCPFLSICQSQLMPIELMRYSDTVTYDTMQRVTIGDIITFSIVGEMPFFSVNIGYEFDYERAKIKRVGLPKYHRLYWRTEKCMGLLMKITKEEAKETAHIMILDEYYTFSYYVQDIKKEKCYGQYIEVKLLDIITNETKTTIYKVINP